MGRKHHSGLKIALGKIAFVLCLALAFTPAQASGCRFWPRIDSLAHAEGAYAASRQVFIGRLAEKWQQPVPEPPMPECEQTYHPEGGAECLERIQITSGPGRSSWLGRFAVERQFKGQAASPLVVRIRQHLVVGEAYLVYAEERLGEWAADRCISGTALAMQEDLSVHLDYLGALPPSGAGGFAELYLKDPHGVIDSPLALAFEGPEVEAEIEADKQQPRRSDQLWPPGRYALETEPPEGYRFSCRPEPCNQLVLQDRAVNTWTVSVDALARITVILRDSRDERVEVDAEFQMLDHTTGQPVAFQRDWLGNSDKTAIEGRLPPGKVVPALVITDVVPDGWRHVVVSREHWFSEGRVFEEAAAVAIVAGDNTVTFRLPETLDPIAVDLKMHGLNPWRRSEHASLELLGWAQAGETAQTHYHSFFCRADQPGPCQRSFIALPGQSWSLSAPLNHRFADGDDKHRLLELRDTVEVYLKPEAE